ncbi:MAG: hypothetical protein AAGN82_19500 [Myxococcota bacterium]
MGEPLNVYAPFVEAFLVVPFFVMGVSHVVQARMWRDFFVRLAERGEEAIIVRSFMLELWPAVLIVTFHQVWRGPAAVLTLYGHLLCAKVALAMVYPRVGMASLKMAKTHGEGGFRKAGLVLIGLGGLCVWLVVSG